VSMNVRTEVQQVVYDMLKANEVKTKTKVK
jgi:hypothetical protein